MHVLARDNAVSLNAEIEIPRERSVARPWRIVPVVSDTMFVTLPQGARPPPVSQPQLGSFSVSAKSSVRFISSRRWTSRDIGETTRRLEALAKSASTWAPELEVEPPSTEAVQFVRTILALIPSDIADKDIRVFPSEGGGILLQTMKPQLRILEVDPGQVLATVLIDEAQGRAVTYAIDSKEAAAAFISGA